LKLSYLTQKSVAQLRINDCWISFQFRVNSKGSFFFVVAETRHSKGPCGSLKFYVYFPHVGYSVGMILRCHEILISYKYELTTKNTNV